MVTVGIVIGAGIFETPALVAGIAGSPSAMLAAWMLGGALSLAGALVYAELASTWPGAGGDYAFLTRAYGRSVGFLFAWARGAVICTGSIALLAFILGDYLTRLHDLGAYSSAIYAAISIATLTAMNLAGLRASSKMQNVLAAVEIGAVLAVAVAGLTVAAPASDASTGTQTAPTPGAFGLAMVFVLLTYGGWNEAAYVSAEVRGGPRAILRALVASIAVVALVYLLFVAGALRALGFEGLRASDAVGIDVIGLALGAYGAPVIGVAVAVASLTSMNATMIVGARSNYAVARDWRALAFMRGWQGDRGVPLAGYLVQGAVALALVAFGALEQSGFSTMVEFTAPVFWFFFTLSGFALFVLRRREPAVPRPFRVPLYPLIPAIFVLTCVGLLYSSIVHAQSRNAGFVALAVMASGAAALLALRRGEAARGEAP